MGRFENEHLIAEVAGGKSVLVVTRKPSRPARSGELLEAYEEALGAPAAEHKRWTVTIDSREAPPSNTPELEAELGTIRARLHAQFGRIVIVVKTAAGMLQARRLNEREVICADMDEAIAIARTPIPGGSTGDPPAR